MRSISASHFAAVFDRHPRAHNALDFRIEYFTGQTILRNTVTHHAAAGLCAFDHVHGVAGLAQMVSRAQASGTCAHHQHALTGLFLRLGQIPALGKRIVSEETLYRINAHGFVKSTTVTGCLASVIAHASHAGRKRIVGRNALPGFFVIARFGRIQPRLTLFAGWTLGVARRQTIDVGRLDGTPGARAVFQRTTHIERDGKRCIFLSHFLNFRSQSVALAADQIT